MKFLAIFVWAFICIGFNVIHGEQYDVWGDLRRTPLVVGESAERYAFPLIKRVVEISYPHEFDNSHESYGIVRGIKHSNNLHEDNCQPEATLIDGGINERTATVKITSERGCGIDSLVEFFIEQL